MRQATSDRAPRPRARGCRASHPTRPGARRLVHVTVLLLVVAIAAAAVPFDAVVVDADRHLELRDEWRTEQSNTLSIVEVAEQMAVKQEVAYHLVRQGLLQTATAATHRRNQRVAMQQLQEFKTAYVWLRDLARGARTSPKHLRTLLDKEGIRPISGPDVDGCRQTLFRRACLQARPAILGTISLPEDVAT